MQKPFFRISYVEIDKLKIRDLIYFDTWLLYLNVMSIVTLNYHMTMYYDTYLHKKNLCLLSKLDMWHKDLSYAVKNVVIPLSYYFTLSRIR